MTTVKQACHLAPNALSIYVSDQIEQLEQLINDEGNGEAFYRKPSITAGMRELLRGTIERFEPADLGGTARRSAPEHR